MLTTPQYKRFACLLYNVVHFLHIIVYLIINHMKCDIQDEEQLQTENLPSRLRIAIGVRAGEKKVLQQINDIFKQREEELDGLEYYQERRLKDIGLVGDNGEIIFWET